MIQTSAICIVSNVAATEAPAVGRWWHRRTWSITDSLLFVMSACYYTEGVSWWVLMMLCLCGCVSVKCSRLCRLLLPQLQWKMRYKILQIPFEICLSSEQCFDTVGWTSGRACNNWVNEESLWLSVWSEVQIVCMWSSWCHCHRKTSSSLASFKSRLVLPFWYRLTLVGLEKRPLNGCSSSSFEQCIE